MHNCQLHLPPLHLHLSTADSNCERSKVLNHRCCVFHLLQPHCQLRGAGVRAMTDSWSAPDTYCKANSLTCKEGEWWMASWGWIFIFLESHLEHHSCWLSDSAASLIYFWRRSFLVPHRYPPPPPFWRGSVLLSTVSPHVGEISLVNLAGSQCCIDGTCWCLLPPHPLRFMCSLDWPSITEHAQWAPCSDKKAKSRPIHYRGFGSPGEPHPHDWLEEHQQDW